MGVVYKARQATLGRIVAVKMVLAGHLSSEEDIQRFVNEAATAANLKHPGIVPIHEVGQHNGQRYFSMDLVEGGDLAERMLHTPPSRHEAVLIVKQICEAIGYAHSRGTIHRDIKPSNILINPSGQVLVTDFGLALRVKDDHELTRTGQALGTPGYMSPEQASGKRTLVGPHSDIYAIGAVFYELLTGRPPFRGETAAETIQQVLTDEPVAPVSLVPATPRDLDTVCLKCLQKDPDKRYESVATLAADLDRYLAGEPILARPIGRLERTLRWCHRKPAVAGLAGTVVVLLIAGTAVSSYFAVQAEQRARSAAFHKAEAVAAAGEHARARKLAEERLAILTRAIEKLRRRTEFMEVSTDDVRGLLARGNAYAELGMWNEASVDLLAAAMLEESHPSNALSAAAVLLERRDYEAFDRLSREMIRRHSDSGALSELLFASHACLLAPADDSVPQQVEQMVQRLLPLAHDDTRLPWAHLVAALCDLRSGRAAASLAHTEKALGTDEELWGREAELHFIRALGFHQINNGRAARMEFERGAALLVEHQPMLAAGPGVGWHDWLICQHLRNEAEAALHGRTLSRSGVSVESVGSPILLFRSAKASVRADRWHRAALDFENGARSSHEPRSLTWLKAASLHAYAASRGVGDVRHYQRTCRGMLEIFGTTNEWGPLEQTLKACLLLPGKVDREEAMEHRLATLRVDGSAPKPLRAWMDIALALAAVRRHATDDATNLADRGLELAKYCPNAKLADVIRSCCRAVEGLACVQQADLCRAEAAVHAAREHLSEHIERHEDGSVRGGSLFTRNRFEHDVLIAEILIREAEAALGLTDTPTP